MTARAQAVRIGHRLVGPGHPVYVVAEIGINHNGELDVAKKLIDAARLAGCDAVKFQKRTPEICVPPGQWELERDTPWGRMTYLDYRRKVEFGRDDYAEIDAYCCQRGMTWFASCWDEPSVDLVSEFDVPAYKVASACLTDHVLIKRTVAEPGALVLSTGMSTMDQIRSAAGLVPRNQLVLTHATSTYPCPPDELNLRMIHTLAAEFGVPVGYSGHEVGLQGTLAAVGMGACLVERHVTLDRSMWGSDQAASVEPAGLMRLVRDIRLIEKALGDGVKKVYDSERGPMGKLRRVS
jgi:N-acetylneuraminate synthase